MTRIIILHDVVPDDAREDQLDNLYQAELVETAIKALDYTYLGRFAVDLDFKKLENILDELRPDIVFNLVESINNSDQLAYTVPAFLQAKGIRFTGASFEALMLSANKVSAKQIMKANNILTADSSFTKSANKYIIKSITEHASFGIDDSAVVHVSSQTELDSLVESRSRLIGSQCFAEVYIDGREFSVHMIDGKPLCVSEMVFNFPAEKPKIANYKSKWDFDSFEYNNMTPTSFEFTKEDGSLARALEPIAIQCWKVFNLTGYARIDFRVDASNTAYVLEINANNGIPKDVEFGECIRHIGKTYNWAIDKIIKCAL